MAAKLFILQGSVGATFFRSCLGGAQSIAYRNVAVPWDSTFPRKAMYTRSDDFAQKLDFPITTE